MKLAVAVECRIFYLLRMNYKHEGSLQFENRICDVETSVILTSSQQLL